MTLPSSASFGGEQPASKFVQIAASNYVLYALDDEGRVWIHELTTIVGEAGLPRGWAAWRALHPSRHDPLAASDSPAPTPEKAPLANSDGPLDTPEGQS